MRLGQVAALRAIGQRQAEEPAKPRVSASGATRSSARRITRTARRCRTPPAGPDVRRPGAVRTVARSARADRRVRMPPAGSRRPPGRATAPGAGMVRTMPASPRPVGGMGQQRLLPDQADRQQVGQRGVGAAACSACQDSQRACCAQPPRSTSSRVKRRRGGIRASGPGWPRRAGWPVGRVGRGGDMRAEPPQSGNFGGQVVDRHSATPQRRPGRGRASTAPAPDRTGPRPTARCCGR